MKLLGMLLVFLSGLCLGVGCAGELRNREKALLDLKQTIQALKTGVEFSARPLCELIEALGDSRFCRLAAKSPCFFSEPKAALEQAGERLLKKEEDLALYRGFVSGLGESDTQGQMEHMELYAALLERNLSQAGEAREKKSRLYVCLGLFGGLAVCLILA